MKFPLGEEMRTDTHDASFGILTPKWGNNGRVSVTRNEVRLDGSEPKTERRDYI